MIWSRVRMDYAGVWRSTLRWSNYAVGMDYAGVSWSTLHRSNYAVRMHYAGLSRRTLSKQIDEVGMQQATVSQSTMRQGDEAVCMHCGRAQCATENRRLACSTQRVRYALNDAESVVESVTELGHGIEH